MKTLREAREERGIKQIAVANHLKIARQTYAKYEDNPRGSCARSMRAATMSDTTTLPIA